MAHEQQLTWVQCAAHYFGLDARSDLRVVEIGSYDVNGSIRPFFDAEAYVGVDFIEGPGVDLIADVRTQSIEGAPFDVAISCNAFEHDADWRGTLAAMVGLVEPGGLVMATCASRGFPEHGTIRTERSHSPGTQAANSDHYRNVLVAEVRRLPLRSWFTWFDIRYNPYARDLYFVGKVRGAQGRLVTAWDPAAFREATQPAFRWGGWQRPTSRLAWLRFHVARRSVGALAWLLPDPAYQNVRLWAERLAEWGTPTVARTLRWLVPQRRRQR